MMRERNVCFASLACSFHFNAIKTKPGWRFCQLKPSLLENCPGTRATGLNFVQKRFLVNFCSVWYFIGGNAAYKKWWGCICKGFCG